MSIKLLTLMMLEDSGLQIEHPKINQAEIESNGGKRSFFGANFSSGRRVTIEQNPKIKFLMMFTLLDIHVDSIFPNMEGCSLAKKYKSIPKEGCYNIILRELYRVSKLIRNSLVHTSSSFTIDNECLNIKYNFKNTNYRLKVSLETLGVLYTCLLLYVKDNMGRGEYFLGMLLVLYKKFVAGVDEFSDEFQDGIEKSLHLLSDRLEISPYRREVVLNSIYDLSDGFVQIKINNLLMCKAIKTDFHLVHKGVVVLLPIEALDEELKINEQKMLVNWKYEGPFPSLTKSN